MFYDNQDMPQPEVYFPAHQKELAKIKDKLSANTKIKQEEILEDVVDLLDKMLHTIGKLEARNNSYRNKTTED